MTNPTYNYRTHLWNIFELRSKRNPLYSLSAFARDLGISSSLLSLVLHKKKGLSFKTAEKMVIKLGLTKAQSEQFMQSIESLHSRARKAKAKYPGRVREEQIPRKMKVSANSFELNWRHLVLREYLQLPDFEPQPAWLAKKMNTSEKEAQLIWQQSLQAGFIVADENGFRASEHLIVGDQGRNDSLRQVQKDLLSHASKAVDLPMEERSLFSIFLTVSEDQYLEMKRLVRTFSSEMANTLKREEVKKKDRVVCLATQIFKV